MTMTAGAHSIQPRLRSARAPSDRGAFLRLPDASWTASVPAVVSELTLIGGFLPLWPARRGFCGGSRDQALRQQGVTELGDHGLLGGGRVDARRRRDQMRDV